MKIQKWLNRGKLLGAAKATNVLRHLGVPKILAGPQTQFSRTQIPESEIEAMKRESVISTNVISVGYDATTETLEVEFKSGIYQYYNVPQSIYDQMMISESKGKFLNVYIKPVYPYAKV